MWHCDVHKQDSGFTLIEMLATAAMVSVIAAIAVPSLVGMLNRYRVQESMREVEGAIKEAQKQAIRNRRTCEIIFNTTTVDGETREFITTDAANNGCLLSNRTLYSNITIAGAPAKITFSSKGNTDNASQGIIIISHSDTNTEKCVQIEGLFGNVTTGNYDGTNCITD